MTKQGGGRREPDVAGSLFDALPAELRPSARGETRPPVRLRRRHEPELAAADVVAAGQLDIFADPVEIHDLTPRLPAAARARVKGVWAVRLSRSSPTHRVFHDRHGWYCEEHGAECPAVERVRSRRR